MTKDPRNKIRPINLLERYTKSNPLNVLLVVYIVFSALSAVLFWRVESIWAVVVGMIVSFFLTEQVTALVNSFSLLIYRLPYVQKLIISVSGFFVVVFFPPSYFFILGAFAGIAIKDTEEFLEEIIEEEEKEKEESKIKKEKSDS